MTKSKTIALIVAVTIISFLATRLIWPTPAHSAMGMPSSGQLPFLILLGIIESLSFGIGVWFVLAGRKVLFSVGNPANKLTTFAYFAISWSLLTWWPHDNLHKVNGENLQGLIYIEYGFHVTLIISAVILALFFLSVLKFKAKD